MIKEYGRHPGRHEPVYQCVTATTVVEKWLESRDGLIGGVLDYAEVVDGACRIIDYKTNMSLEPAEEERHIRQLQLYAFLWFDNYGVWPLEGTVVYVNLGRQVVTPIEPAEASELAQQARQQATALLHDTTAPQDLANPGVACAYCDFRPWCEPFWRRQEEPLDDYSWVELARMGFEGTVTSVAQADDVMLLEVQAIRRLIEIRARIAEFPVLNTVSVDDRIRVLDARLEGVVGRPMANVDGRTEIYRVVR